MNGLVSDRALRNCPNLDAVICTAVNAGKIRKPLAERAGPNVSLLTMATSRPGSSPNAISASTQKPPAAMLSSWPCK